MQPEITDIMRLHLAEPPAAPPEILADLIRLSKPEMNTDATLRLAAVRALGNFNLPEAVESLVAAMDDPAERIQLQAIAGLEKLGNDSASPALLRKFGNSPENSLVALAAARALTRLGTENAVHRLADRWRGKKHCWLAAWALGTIGAAAVETLAGHLSRAGRIGNGVLSGARDGEEHEDLTLPNPSVNDREPFYAEAALALLQHRHWVLLRDIKNLLCERCLLRPRQGRRPYGVFRAIHYVYCRGCRRSDRLGKIPKLIGTVGPRHPPQLRDGRLLACLWSGERARNADLDELHILATPDIDLDQAVDAVVRTLKNDPNHNLAGIPVFLRASPRLSRNTVNMLQREFASVTSV